MKKLILALLMLVLIPMVYSAGTYPIVTKTAPTDAQLFTATTVPFTYTPSDDSGDPQKCELWGNFQGDITTWALNSTNQTQAKNNQPGTITITNIPDGNYRYNIRCFDPITSIFNMWSWANQSAWVDGFDYTAGLLNNTTPNWVAQYNQPRWVNITPWKTLRVDAIAEYQGDRDMHVALNVSAIPTTSRKIVVQYQYNVSQCNSTFKVSQGINPIGSAVYLNYFDGDNFIDVEFKVNSNNTLCNGGLSQVSANKRIGGVTYSLLPFTQVWFITNRTYNVRVELATHNSTNYNMTIWFNGTVIASTTNISNGEIFDGQTLVENAGTVTDYDNITVALIEDYTFSVDTVDEITQESCTDIQNGIVSLNNSLSIVVPAVLILLILIGAVFVIINRENTIDAIQEIGFGKILLGTFVLILTSIITIMAITLIGGVGAC